MTQTETELLLAKLNLETARIRWVSLQRNFAQGKVLAVASGTDLVATAHAMASDDSGGIAAQVESGEISQVSDEQARQWVDTDATVWAVVVAPWVLVQE